MRICVTKMLYLYNIKHEQYRDKIISKFMSIFKHQKVLLGPWISKDSALITSPGKFIHCCIILKQNIFLGFRLNVSFFYVYYYLYQYSHKMWVSRFPFHFLLLYSFMEQGGRIGLWYKIRMVFLCFDRAIWNFLPSCFSKYRFLSRCQL